MSLNLQNEVVEAAYKLNPILNRLLNIKSFFRFSSDPPPDDYDEHSYIRPIQSMVVPNKNRGDGDIWFFIPEERRFDSSNLLQTAMTVTILACHECRHLVQQKFVFPIDTPENRMLAAFDIAGKFLDEWREPYNIDMYIHDLTEIDAELAAVEQSPWLVKQLFPRFSENEISKAVIKYSSEALYPSGEWCLAPLNPHRYESIDDIVDCANERARYCLVRPLCLPELKPNSSNLIYFLHSSKASSLLDALENQPQARVRISTIADMLTLFNPRIGKRWFGRSQVYFPCSLVDEHIRNIPITRETSMRTENVSVKIPFSDVLEQIRSIEFDNDTSANESCQFGC